MKNILRTFRLGCIEIFHSLSDLFITGSIAALTALCLAEAASHRDPTFAFIGLTLGFIGTGGVYLKGQANRARTPSLG